MIDILLVVLFLLGIGWVIYGYTESVTAPTAIDDVAQVRADQDAQVTSTNAVPTETSGASIESADISSPQNQPTDESKTVDDSMLSDLSQFTSRIKASSTPEDDLLLGQDPIGGVGSTTGFANVTTTRYENTRLGFVMELPQNWIQLYESGNEVSFINQATSYGQPLAPIKQNSGTQWITVRKPCESTVATSSIFVFTNEANAATAVACIPPLLITLGVRADTPDLNGSERLLQNIARTIYPIVVGVAPYAPIR